MEEKQNRIVKYIKFWELPIMSHVVSLSLWNYFLCVV